MNSPVLVVLAVVLSGGVPDPQAPSPPTPRVFTSLFRDSASPQPPSPVKLQFPSFAGVIMAQEAAKPTQPAQQDKQVLRKPRGRELWRWLLPLGCDGQVVSPGLFGSKGKPIDRCGPLRR